MKPPAVAERDTGESRVGVLGSVGLRADVFSC